jgi:diguanylate cyclase (GGDEF)-like protein
MADIDHFKNVNDQYGHEAGDRVIVAVAKALAEGCVISIWLRVSAAMNLCC